MRRLLLCLACASTLSACTGVIDNCPKGLAPPMDGWGSSHR